jgi:hypothetical protein
MNIKIFTCYKGEEEISLDQRSDRFPRITLLPGRNCIIVSLDSKVLIEK